MRTSSCGWGVDHARGAGDHARGAGEVGLELRLEGWVEVKQRRRDSAGVGSRGKKGQKVLKT